MSYSGIIFDKDGTLFDYYTVWAPIIMEHTDKILDAIELKNHERIRLKFLQLLGIGDGKMLPGGLVFRTNLPYMMFQLFLFCLRFRLPFSRVVSEIKTGFKEAHQYIEKSLCSLTEGNTTIELFRKLKEAGYSVGVVTSDTLRSTEICLKTLGIEKYIDFISNYDDSFAPKPNPESLYAFCKRFSLDPSEVAVVGDSPVDMKYAHKGGAGYSIALLTGSSDRRRLLKYTKTLYPDLSSLLADPKLFPGS